MPCRLLSSLLSPKENTRRSLRLHSLPLNQATFSLTKFTWITFEIVAYMYQGSILSCFYVLPISAVSYWPRKPGDVQHLGVYSEFFGIVASQICIQISSQLSFLFKQPIYWLSIYAALSYYHGLLTSARNVVHELFYCNLLRTA